MSDEALEREVDRQIEAMRDGTVDFHGEADLRKRLRAALEAGRPLRVKLGMDPSSPDLHLGHSVVLLKLKRFLELGHQPIFLVGDFTARIGDPSGKKKTRPALSEEEVQKNAETYVEQVGRILDTSAVEVRFNSEWMNALGPADFVRLCSHQTIARLLERDDFEKRYRAGEPIALHEFLYPMVQGYDSVALEADVELGGTDQLFNLLMGRELQRAYDQAPQAVLTHPLLVGTDGSEKMSKSLGNAIGITDAPEDIYGKVMSISDPLMQNYIELLSAGSWGELEQAAARVADGEGDPLALKHDLAFALVERIAGPEAAEAGRAHFRAVIQKGQTPDEVPERRATLAGEADRGLLELLEEFELTQSRGEARRLVQQGAVSVDGEKVAEATARLGPGSYLIKVGKRRFLRLILE